VRNVVSKLRPFAANITYLCHLDSSKLFFRFPRQLEPLPATLIRPAFQNNTDGRWANEGTPTLQLAELLVYLEGHPGPSLGLLTLSVPYSMPFAKNPLPDEPGRGQRNAVT